LDKEEREKVHFPKLLRIVAVGRGEGREGAEREREKE